MDESQWIALIVSAATDPDGDTMRSLAKHLAACERAGAWLRAKGYGKQGQAIDLMVGQVPTAHGY